MHDKAKGPKSLRHRKRQSSRVEKAPPRKGGGGEALSKRECLVEAERGLEIIFEWGGAAPGIKEGYLHKGLKQP